MVRQANDGRPKGDGKATSDDDSSKVVDARYNRPYTGREPGPKDPLGDRRGADADRVAL